MYPLTSIARPYRGLRFGATKFECLYPLTSYYFSNDHRLKFNFFKGIWNKLCLWAALLKFWFQTDLRHENSAGFYILGRQSVLSFLAMVTRWSCSTSNFYALIGQNLTGELMRKIYAASGNLFSDSWSWQSFVSPYCHVFNCVFPLDVQNEYSCYHDSSVIHGWFVYWVYGWEMRRFRMATFSFFTLLDA